MTSAPPAPWGVRRAGVLLHVTSLPEGDLGPAAYAFVDFLAEASAQVWQVLPLVPTHEGDGSPYNAMSALAGNPDLLHLGEYADTAAAAEAFLGGGGQADLDRWCAGCDWLTDFVEYVVLREAQGGVSWTEWVPELRDRHPEAVAEVLAEHERRATQVRWEQFEFARQWGALHDYAADRGVIVFGDLPIFVSLDSADVWSARELFDLDAEGCPITVTGVPPDYFAAHGQRWNNPHYDWAAMADEDFGWWRRRIAAQRRLFDLVRIDHFRGFEAAWHIPAEAETAREGRWEPSPGNWVLPALIEESGPSTLVAEDLGVITPEVTALRQRFGLPGMKILQFAFDGTPANPYLPERHGLDAVAYTGTHDNDTTLGWWDGLTEEVREKVRGRLLDPEEEMPWAFIRLALSSTALLCVVPAQDLLELGSEARMNTPGVAEGNWTWRAPSGAFTGEVAARLRRLVEEYHRAGQAPPL